MRSRIVTTAAVLLMCGCARGIELDLENCKLRVGNEDLKPVAVTNPWRMECRADGTTLLVSKNEIAKPERGSGTGWTAKSDDHHWLHWLAADKQIAYVLGYKLLLSVPFKGKIAAPETNYRSGNLPDGSCSYRTRSYYEASVTGLRSDGDQLEIVLGMEKWSASVTFTIPKLLLQQSVSGPEPAEGDAVKGARDRVRTLDPQSLNEVLMSAGHGTDVDFIRALLESGADPKEASREGWTALMVAAAYGTADMIDVLVQAGSDVNACDKNCGGQTVLMWAARSGREPKRKVQLLLKAGANMHATSAGGYNALMSAAGSGDLPTVELLLQAGLRHSHRNKHNETVLMVAAHSGRANVVRALIDAGADVNAVDATGMTPLMHAGDGFDAADAVKLLLESGADPHAKDKKGRTALQIADASQYRGAKQVVALLTTATQPQKPVSRKEKDR